MDDILGDGARLLDSMTPTGAKSADVIRYDPAAYERAYTRLKRAPLELDAADFAQLEIIDPDFVTQAWEARRLAQLEIVRQCGGSYGSTAQSAPLEVKAAPAPAREELSWDEHVAKHGNRPMKVKDGAVIRRCAVRVLKTHKTKINDGLMQSKGRFETLEARLAALEKKPSVKFCGAFERGKAYVAGDACVHKVRAVDLQGADEWRAWRRFRRLAIGAQTR